ncbi:MAG: CaiB/BaiF CoA transferase family protein [Anaerotruncus massiliensis (ex Togo et al. 2019)]
MNAPLEGIRVLDLSRFISGPYCGMVLGDLGADVVKAEKAGSGDDTRVLPLVKGRASTPSPSTEQARHRARLPQRRGPGKLFRLACTADVDRELQGGTIEKMGLDYEELKTQPRPHHGEHHRLRSGRALPDKPGFDAAVQAMSGLMSITGEPDGMPMMYGTYAVDYATALYAAVAALSALHVRHLTGRGQHIRLSLLECAASLLLTGIPDYCATGHVTGRVGNRDRYTAPGNCFKTKDGEVLMIIAGNQSHFLRLVKAMEMEWLLEDERFAKQEVRFEHAAEIEEIVAGWVASHELDELRKILDAAGTSPPRWRTSGTWRKIPSFATGVSS